MSGFRRVRLSDVQLITICPDFRHTVNVRLPDLRFGEPDIKLSGFRISGFRTCGSITLSPDFRSIQLPKCSKSGQYCPVIGRLVPIGRLKSGRFTTPLTFEIRRFEIRTLFRPVCQTGRPVIGRLLYMTSLTPCSDVIGPIFKATFLFTQQRWRHSLFSLGCMTDVARPIVGDCRQSE